MTVLGTMPWALLKASCFSLRRSVSSMARRMEGVMASAYKNQAAGEVILSWSCGSGRKCGCKGMIMAGQVTISSQFAFLDRTAAFRLVHGPAHGGGDGVGVQNHHAVGVPDERERSGQIVEQVIRPTGLLDPRVEVRPVEGQIDDLIGEITERTARDEREVVQQGVGRRAHRAALDHPGIVLNAGAVAYVPGAGGHGGDLARLLEGHRHPGGVLRPYSTRVVFLARSPLNMARTWGRVAWLSSMNSTKSLGK